MTWRIILAVVSAVVLLVVAALAVLSRLSKPPSNLGAESGRLAPCPSSPNCVCSFDADAGHAIEPLAMPGEASAALDRIETVLKDRPRCRVVERTGPYLRAEFTSALFRFVDDVEFLADAENGVIHVRSASRAGHSDLGVNRKRVEELRKRLSP